MLIGPSTADREEQDAGTVQLYAAFGFAGDPGPVTCSLVFY